MTRSTCPSCGFDLNSDVPDLDPGVVRWFSAGDRWTGEASTAELYADYLCSATGTPVTRARFVADLGRLGVEEVLDGDTRILIND